MLKKIVVENWILSKISFISFRGRMLKSNNLKMGTSSKAQFTLTVRTVSVYIAKANVLKSGQYFLLSKKLEKWFPKSAIFHRCSVPSTDNRMRNSFDAIDIKSVCDKMKTYTRDFKMEIHICNKKEVLDIEKIQLLVVAFLTNY